MSAGRERSAARHDALAGAVVGFENIARVAALSSLIFAGSLSGGAPAVVAIFLLTGVLATLALAIGRNFSGAVFSVVHNTPIAILLPLLAMVGTSAETVGGAAAGVLATFMLMGAVAVAAGLAMIAMSVFDLGRFVRLLPYPVATGFLAATGALLMRSALLLVHADAVSFTTRSLLMPGLAVGFALLLVFGTRVMRNTGLVVMLAIGIAGTHVILWILGVDLAAAHAIGLLQAPAPSLGLFSGANMQAALSVFDMETLGLVLPVAGSAVFISLIGITLNITGSEIILNRDIDSRPALLRAGAVNILTGSIGSSISYINAPNTVAARQPGAMNRLPVWTMCATTLVIAPFAEGLYLHMPQFISAGLLLYSGWVILRDWLLAQYRRLSLADWSISVLIVLISQVFGIAAAVGFGILAASLIFAVVSARLPVIRMSSDLHACRSSVDRAPSRTAYLDTHGREVAVVALQGFLFFGSVVRLTAHIRTLLAREAPPRTVILDFARVSRIDAAAIAAIRKLERLAAAHHGHIVLAGMNDAVGAEIARSDLVIGNRQTLRRARDADSALEAAEEELLARGTFSDDEETALGALTQMTGDPAISRRLLALFERETLSKGDVLIRQGDRAGDVFLIDSGTLCVHLNTNSGSVLRLRVLRPGALVGEIASYADLPRTADVIAETEAVVYRASETAVRKAARSAPDLAAALHRIVAATLAERLDRTTKLLGDQT